MHQPLSRFSWILTALTLTVVVACQTAERDPTYKRKIPEPYRVGSVAFVNSDNSFVLLRMDPGYAPEPGREFRAVADGIVRSVVRVTPQKQRPFFVANVIEGAPAVGDTIFHYPKAGTEPEVGRGG